MTDGLSNPSAEQLNRYRPIVPDWDAFIEVLGRPLPLCLWTNTLRTTPAVVTDWLDYEQIDAHPLPWFSAAYKGRTPGSAGQTIAFVAGLYHVQEEVSLIPVILLDPKPGERVLDTCAAPGSKSALIAVAMGNRGTLISNDRNALRHRATRGTLDRLGIVNTTITVQDAAKYPLRTGRYDRVLADVPCTCEGTSRKHYAAFENSGPEASRRIAGTQLAILRRAIELCRPGGRVVYSTCTYAPEENEIVVDAALNEFAGEVDLLPARIEGFVSSPGITAWNGQTLDPRIKRAMRIWPHQNDTGGFFAAVLEKSDLSKEHADVGTNAPLGEDGGGLPVESEGQSAWFELLRDRFGFRADAFDPLRLVQTSKKYIRAVSSDHVSSAGPEPVSIGMPIIRAQLQYPKLTTAGAMLLGAHAAKNVVDATGDQAARYLARKEFLLTPNQLIHITDTGYVLVRLRAVTLGVALCYVDERRVLSMYPKVLSRTVTDRDPQRTRYSSLK